MKILFLPVYHYPEKAASLYLGENAREAYAREGWEMKMYCPIPSRGVSREVREEYSVHPDSDEIGGALKIHRFPIWREGKAPLGRAFRYWICQRKHYALAKKERDTDVLFISSTPPIQGLLMTKLKKKLGCKTVYNLQDIFPDSLVNAKMTRKGSLIWRLGRRIEDITYKNADKIIVISERFKRNIMEKGVPEDKIEVVYNWADEEAVHPVVREDNPLFDRFGLDKSKFYITYCGNLGKSQNFDVLLSAAQLLSSNSDIVFVVIGNGVCKQELEANIMQMSLGNVKVFDFLPYEEISNVFGLGDVSLIISKAGVGISSVPSKTWSIMSAERAVIASFDTDSELCDMIRDSECGVCIPPDDGNALADAIKKLYENKVLCESLGKNGRKKVLTDFSKKIGCDKLVNVIKSVCD